MLLIVDLYISGDGRQDHRSGVRDLMKIKQQSRTLPPSALQAQAHDE
jgi:hypothetical protein